MQKFSCDDINNFLADFHQYLIVFRDRDPATADAYVYDAREYVKFLRALPEHDTEILAFDITPELITSYF